MSLNKRAFLRMPVFVLLAFFLVLASSSCKTSSNLAGGDLKKRSARFLMKQLLEQQIEAEWFSAKAKIAYDDPYESVNLTAYIRMRKDSVIWMNFKKLSVEAVRLQITPDSVYIIDRLNNQYAIRSLSYLQETFQLPATFEGIQNLLLGNPVFFTTDLDAEIAGQQYQLSGTGSRFSNTYLLNGISYFMEGLILEDQHEDRRMVATLGDYRIMDDAQNFSYFRNISLLGGETGDVTLSMELSKVEINVPKSIRFDIPDRYSPME